MEVTKLTDCNSVLQQNVTHQKSDGSFAKDNTRGRNLERVFMTDVGYPLIILL